MHTACNAVPYRFEPHACARRTLRARVWIAANHFFSRDDAQANCWLWLHHDDGRVLALRLHANCLERDELIAPLLAAFAADPQSPNWQRVGIGPVWELPHAPVVPVPRWAVSWGHPVQCAIRDFAAGLDADVLTALGRFDPAGPFFGSTYNYNQLAVLPQPLRQHRLQALTDFPPLVAPLLLSGVLRPDMFGTDTNESRWSVSASPVFAAIDLGQDLIGALAQQHRIDRALVRSPLCRRPWRCGRIPRDVLRLLHALPAHARPHEVEHVEARLDLLLALPLRADSSRDTERLARAFASGWNRVWRTLEQRFGPLAPRLRDTRDFLAAALGQGAVPATLSGIDVERLGLAWIARRGLSSLLAASQRWHARPVSAISLDDTLPDSVVALLGGPIPGNAIVRELTHRQTLVDEGTSMHHCVADYWQQCVLAGTRIVHLETAQGERATAEYEFAFAAQPPTFCLVQLRGPCNAEPTDAMEHLATTTEQQLNSSTLSECRRRLAIEVMQARQRHLYAPAPRRLRPLDLRSRQELAMVLAYCVKQEDWLAAPDELLRGRIAGFHYASGPALLDRLATGDTLTLVREPDNAHDCLAVRLDWNGHKLGYVPRPDNERIALLLDAGDALAATISAVRSDEDSWAPVEFKVIRESCKST
ncbi:MAG: PcfJ domain-containing protein [Proteobacteria bacterium]|nr:PcfJ domain-containing protein [Pseudomonadota bacterium]